MLYIEIFSPWPVSYNTLNVMQFRSFPAIKIDRLFLCWKAPKFKKFKVFKLLYQGILLVEKWEK